MLFNALPHNPEGSGERLLGQYGPLVSELCSFVDSDFLSNLRAELSFVTLTVRLYNGLNDKNLVNPFPNNKF